MSRCIVLLALFIGFCPGLQAVTAPTDSTGDQILVPPLVAPDGFTVQDGLLTSTPEVVPVAPAPQPIATRQPVSDNGDAAAASLSLTIGTGNERSGYSNVIKILLLITVLAVAPGFLMMMTSFTRVIIVLGFVRRALGTQTLPPNQVMLGLALFLTLFVMAPTFQAINQNALQPYMAEEITESQAVDISISEVRGFMAKHTRKADLALFIKIAGEERPASIDEVSFLTLIPAFVTSELKTAFQMGFIIFLPFVIIDLVIAAVLMALGMMMLPPVMISLPFKILLFVLVDGWVLLMQSIVASYGGG